ncbi:MAG: biotin--[acetyl-CoA-carboxylase] ligase [Azospirillum sp.]|nr:biotin--[acetyl-CoA-carboxylase] ligase [Azospirillum sp.]
MSDPAAATGFRLLGAYRLVAFDRVGSTNDEARRFARDGAADGVMIWARSQDSGRGRRGRSWVSTEGNLFCSLVLRPQCPMAVAAQLSFVAALAVADAVAAALPTDRAPRLKWPNDVLVGGRKVAGILIEAEADSSGGLGWVVVGLGVNVHQFPADTEFPATALAVEGAVGVSAESLLGAFAARFHFWRRCWAAEGFPRIRTAWLAVAEGLGREVDVRLANETLHGRFVDLDSDGALVLELAGGGGLRRISAGDVFFAPSAAEA